MKNRNCISPGAPALSRAARNRAFPCVSMGRWMRTCYPVISTPNPIIRMEPMKISRKHFERFRNLTPIYPSTVTIVRVRDVDVDVCLFVRIVPMRVPLLRKNTSISLSRSRSSKSSSIGGGGGSDGGGDGSRHPLRNCCCSRRRLRHRRRSNSSNLSSPSSGAFGPPDVCCCRTRALTCPTIQLSHFCTCLKP